MFAGYSRLTLLALALVGAGAMVGFGLKSVLAQGIPATSPLYYTGTLSEAGQLVNAARPVTINLWLNKVPAIGEVALCSTAVASTPVINGRFRVALDPSCKAAINANPDVYVEVMVNGASLGRSKIGAVPYAVEAEHATSADKAASGSPLALQLAQLQSSVQGKLAGVWAANPAVGCVTLPAGSDWTDTPGASVTFTLASAASVWATYAINVQPTAASGGDFVSFRLVVDGAPQSMSGNHLQPYATADENFTTVGNYVASPSLPPGPHTIKLQWTATNGGTSWQNCYGDGAWTVSASQQTSIGQRSLVALAWYQ